MSESPVIIPRVKLIRTAEGPFPYVVTDDEHSHTLVRQGLLCPPEVWQAIAPAIVEAINVLAGGAKSNRTLDRLEIVEDRLVLVASAVTSLCTGLALYHGHEDDPTRITGHVKDAMRCLNSFERLVLP